jgi:predicted DNA-binding transcriptional regulator AlpA
MTTSRSSAHEQRINDEINRVRASFNAWADDICLNENEVSIAIGMSRPWLKAARKNNTGPRHFLVSTSVVRYRVGDVREWLKTQCAADVKASRGGRRQPKGANTEAHTSP